MLASLAPVGAASVAAVDGPLEPADLRAGDADRERVADLLREAAGDGRLTLGELEERLEATYAARTYGELARVTADLSAQRPGGPPLPAPRPGGVLSRVERMTAVFGEEKRGGRWEVPERIEARAVFGSVELDLTDAMVRSRDVVVEAWAVFGEVTVRVPEGVDVRMEPGVSLFGSRNSSLPAGDEVPSLTLHVRGGAVFGEVSVKPRRRRWLAR
jgi:Domain of unknown function (DUF1707)/Cell wall-active antibiotics response 4TMS YvqF